MGLGPSEAYTIEDVRGTVMTQIPDTIGRKWEIREHVSPHSNFAEAAWKGRKGGN